MGEEMGGHSERKDREEDVICFLGIILDRCHARERVRVTEDNFESAFKASSEIHFQLLSFAFSF